MARDWKWHCSFYMCAVASSSSFSHKYIFNIKIPHSAIKEPLSENSCSNSIYRLLRTQNIFIGPSYHNAVRYERRKFPFYCPNLQARNAPCSRTSSAGGLWHHQCVKIACIHTNAALCAERINEGEHVCTLDADINLHACIYFMCSNAQRAAWWQ